ncbi:MAG: glycosyltransferase family 25 protein [Pelagimonas sp.]
MSDAEFACALSHQRIYRSIIANKWQGAIVLEDDAILDESRFCNFLQQNSYQHSSLIMLDHSHARVPGEKIRLTKNIALLKLSLPSCLTTGYSISAKAAQHLIEAGTPLSDVADWPGDILELEAVVC